MRINLKHGVSVLVLALFVFFALGSGTAEEAVRATEIGYSEIPLSELEQAVQNVKKPGGIGFIVEGYFYGNLHAGYYITDVINGTDYGRFMVHNEKNTPNISYYEPRQFEMYDDQALARIDRTRKYRIYVGVYSERTVWSPYIDRFEGPIDEEIVPTEMPYGELLKLKPEISEERGPRVVKGGTPRIYVTQAYLCRYNGITLSDKPAGMERSWSSNVFEHDIDDDNTMRFRLSPALDAEIRAEGYKGDFDDYLLSKIDLDKTYTVHIGPAVIIDAASIGFLKAPVSWYITKIDGLLSGEEAAANGVRQKARLAGTDKIDRAKFTLIPKDFSPAIYTKIDLFKAIAAVEQMPMGDRSAGSIMLTERRYVSDVVFVSQTGTDILFKTEDDAVSQRMKIDERSGLNAGQKVRLYYRVTRNPLTEWRIDAIERLP
jgi:hypothetical protein